MQLNNNDHSIQKLNTLAYLGSNPQIQSARIIGHKFGFAVDHQEKLTHHYKVVSAETIKESLKELRHLMLEGKVDLDFYSNVVAGIHKLKVPNEQEKNDIQNLAVSILFEMKQPKNKQSFNNLKKVTVDTTLADQKVNLNKQQEIEKELIDSLSRSYVLPQKPDNPTPIQQQGINLLIKYFGTDSKDVRLIKFKNLDFLSTKEDLKVFSKFLEKCTLLRESVVKNLKNETIPSTESPEMKTANDVLGELVASIVVPKERRELIPYFYSMLEIASPVNTQSIQDIFMTAINLGEDLGTVYRRNSHLNAQKAMLEIQRENPEKPEFRKYSPEEAKLVENNFLSRGEGSKIWEKAEWRPELEIPVDKNHRLFVKGTLVYECAVPGEPPKKPAEITLDLMDLGELSVAESELIFSFLKENTFNSKSVPIPPELDFLKDRVVGINTRSAAFLSNEIETIIPIYAHQSLDEIASQLRREVGLGQYKRFMEANNPGLQFS